MEHTDYFHFTQITNKNSQFPLKIGDFQQSLRFCSIRKAGCRFLCFFSLCEFINEAVFLILEHSILRGFIQKKHVKEVKFWPLNSYYKRSD